MVPQSLQKAMGALEKRGNPWGKMERKRADWTKELGEDVPVKILEKGKSAETLYFVDSISCFDDRMQEIARATAKILNAMPESISVSWAKRKRTAGMRCAGSAKKCFFRI